MFLRSTPSGVYQEFCIVLSSLAEFHGLVVRARWPFWLEHSLCAAWVPRRGRLFLLPFPLVSDISQPDRSKVLVLYWWCQCLGFSGVSHGAVGRRCRPSLSLPTMSSKCYDLVNIQSRDDCLRRCCFLFSKTTYVNLLFSTEKPGEQVFLPKPLVSIRTFPTHDPVPKERWWGLLTLVGRLFLVCVSGPQFNRGFEMAQCLSCGNSILAFDQNQCSTLARRGEIPCEKRPGNRDGATTVNGIHGHHGAKTNGVRHSRKLISMFFLRRRIAHQRWQSFSARRVCEQCTVHKGTFPTLAHSSTRGHAPTAFLAWLKIEVRLRPRRSIFAPSKEVIRSHSDLHPSLAWTRSCTARTPCTQTPLSTSTTRRPMSQIAMTPRTPA